MTQKLTLFWGNDWEGLYIDGKLATQGHSISLMEFCKILKIPLKFVEYDDLWLEEETSLPENERDVKIALGEQLGN